jgi:hydroxymethylbilane synthase
MPNPILIATRGSALALAQANLIQAQCRAAFPGEDFELRIIKTTGDKLQTASMAQAGTSLPKGLFTKELEVALLNREADLAVHSLKDLPTELPAGLVLGAVAPRADVRDVLIYRDAAFQRAVSPGQPALRGFPPQLCLADLPAGAVIGTSSTRRAAQLRAACPGLKTTEIRGNVSTRLQKVAERAEFDATILALAGLQRLNFELTAGGRILGEAVPEGLLAVVLETDIMLPCVGQGAIGIEIREQDERIGAVCARLNHAETYHCVTAERAFLRGMGGGCQSPVAAHAEIEGGQVRMRVVSFRDAQVKRGEAKRPVAEAAALGAGLAAELG